jgi:glycosyltransferase involved in cell wall biosynthesis
MRVGVVVPEIQPTAGGGFTLIESILGALEQLRSRQEFVVLHHGENPPRRVGGLATARLAEDLRVLGESVSAAAGEHRIDFVWYLSPDAEPVKLPYAATVWDLEHRLQPYFPEVSVAGWTWEEREYFYRSMLPRAAFVVVGSEEARRQVECFYQVPGERIAVVPFPVDTFTREEIELAGRVRLAAPPAEPFVFYPAQFWPHKNHVAVLHALRALADDHGERVAAVFTGADKGNRGHVEQVVRQLGLQEQVTMLGFVDRPTLVALYRRALALVYPSFFGPDNLPPLEAFALGCPVVAAAVRGVEEQLGDAALYFDPKDEKQLAERLVRLLREPSLRGDLVQRGGLRAGGWTAADYARSVVERVDSFEAIRRCWSREQPYEHL